MLRSTLRWACALTAICLSPSAHAQINFSVTFNDPNGDLTAFAGPITSHVIAAGQRWAQHVIGHGNIEVVVRSSLAVPYAEGRSVTSHFVRNNGTYDVFEQGMTAELRTGVDPNGAGPDVEIEINPDYVTNELWFDPSPNSRTATVDINRTDAMSTFLHEFGHALGYAGWINPTTGVYPGNYQSTLDELTTFDGTNFYFHGAEAMTRYGSAVPMTFGPPTHVANFEPGPGFDLAPDLMNGLFFYRGSRYDISPLNIAMLRDTDVPMVYLTGDYNTDGTVNAADFNVWKNALGSTTATLVDGNRNGIVDAADYTIWRDNLGAHSGAGSTTSLAVPEPASWPIILAAIVSMGMSRRTNSMS